MSRNKRRYVKKRKLILGRKKVKNVVFFFYQL